MQGKRKALKKYEKSIARTAPTMLPPAKRNKLTKYSPDQDRDEHGRWSAGGGDASSYQRGEHVRIAAGHSFLAGETGHVVAGDPHKTGVAPGSSRTGGKQEFVAVRYDGGREVGYHLPSELERHTRDETGRWQP